jgi:hypothetical protein
MNEKRSPLQRLASHWAVSALDEAARNRVEEVLKVRLLRQALGQQMDLSFDSEPEDDDLLHRAALALELAAIEGLPAALNPTSEEDNLREQWRIGAAGAFELRRLMKIPEEPLPGILHVLHLSALAYCGDLWPDLRRWYSERGPKIKPPSAADVAWDQRLLFRLYDGWRRLFRKRSWDDLDRVREIIAGLRQDQKEHESRVLSNGDETADTVMALRLVALYHWARSTELLAVYMLQGEPKGVAPQLDQHFEQGIRAAEACGDTELHILLRWLHAAARRMVLGSLWWVAHSINDRVTGFVDHILRQRGLFELLPPQQVALREQGLLDLAATAIVVDMPTSGGKTLLAQFRILQALNQFAGSGGWVAYVAPTKALTAQITRQLRRDFGPLGILVEELTGAIEIDAFEESLLTRDGKEKAFDILVATPEKLQLVIRNKKVPRPLRLLVLDEAHNLEDEQRGLRIELLLATVKGEYQDQAHFLLLMPYVEKADTLARWLAGDITRGRTISLSTTPWKPNERIVGIYHTEPDDSVRGGWRLTFETLITSPKTLHLKGRHRVDGVKPLDLPKSKITASAATAAMAKVISERGTSIAVANRPDWAWGMARKLRENLPKLALESEKVALVRRFLQTEVGKDFELADMLSHGVGVHHAGLSDETRTLMEWLTEEGELRVLCATSTIAQGINFPVGSVFLSSPHIPQKGRSREMTPREFWNLAGRAGRLEHDSVGVVGIAAGSDPQKIRQLVSRNMGAIISRMVTLLEELESEGRLLDLGSVLYRDDWEDFRCYIAHLLNEKRELDLVLAELDVQLRNTLGYSTLRSHANSASKAEQLLAATRQYATEIAKNPGYVAMADRTGFSFEGVKKAMYGLGTLERKLTADDWEPERLFGAGGGMADLVGVMLQVPQIKNPLEDVGGEGFDQRRIADIARAWVGGQTMGEIASRFFTDANDPTEAMSKACKAIYKAIVHSGTWGFAALSQMGLAFEDLSAEQRRKINSMPAMVYHGVPTEEAVLMRMNSAPRSIASHLGADFRRRVGSAWPEVSPRDARKYLRDLSDDAWHSLRPQAATMNGTDYRETWEILSGEAR